MPYSRNKLENNAREITLAVEKGQLLTLSDLARVTGESKQTLSVHRSRGKLPCVRIGIDNYSFVEDVVKVYPDGPGSKAFLAGTWSEWWAANGRTSRGR